MATRTAETESGDYVEVQAPPTDVDQIDWFDRGGTLPEVPRAPDVGPRPQPAPAGPPRTPLPMEIPGGGEPAPGEVAQTPQEMMLATAGGAPARAATPRPTGTALGQIADALLPGVTKELLGNYQASKDIAAQRDVAMDPLFDAVSQHLAQFNQQMQTNPAYRVPTPPRIPEPPARIARPLLAAVEGESPIQIISKLIQAMGLIGTMGGGLVQGNVRSGLSALTGALQGWQQGDEARMEREYKNWEASTATAIKNYELERSHYADIMTNAKLDLENRLKLLELKGLQWGNRVAAAAAQTKDVQAIADFLAKGAEASAKLEEAHSRTVLAEAWKERNYILAQERVDLSRQRTQSILDERQRRRDAANALSPADIDKIATEYNETGRMPAGTYMLGPEFKGRILSRSTQLLTEAGMSASENLAARDVRQATRTALAQQRSLTTRLDGFIDTLRGQMDQARGLSATNGRAQMPLWNQWVQTGKQRFVGDPQLQQFIDVVENVRNEYMRLMTSPTGGGSAMAEGARIRAIDMLNTAFNHEQFMAALDQMEQGLALRQEDMFLQTKKLSDELISRRIGPPVGQKAPAAGGGAAAPGTAPGATAAPRAAPGAPAAPATQRIPVWDTQTQRWGEVSPDNPLIGTRFLRNKP